MLEDVGIVVFDTERGIQAKEFIGELTENVESKKYTIGVIISIDKFLNEVNEEEFYEIIESAKDKKVMSFIIIENASKLKQHEYDRWYKECISGEDGIFVGKGIDNQYTININDRLAVRNNYALRT